MVKRPLAKQKDMDCLQPFSKCFSLVGFEVVGKKLKTCQSKFIGWQHTRIEKTKGVLLCAKTDQNKHS